MAPVLLNVHAIKSCSEVNGPGVRSVVWTQGCSRACPGCFNPETHAHVRRSLHDPQALGEQLGGRPDTQGVTLSGGEPFEQAEACAVLAEAIRARGKSVMVFTGWDMAELRTASAPAVHRLLAATDLLVAGPYVPRLAEHGRRWCSSRNQQVHALGGEGALSGERLEVGVQEPVVEVDVGRGAARWTGFVGRQELSEVLGGWAARDHGCR